MAAIALRRGQILPAASLAVGLAALALLGGALWLQHGEGFAPCSLCLYQRGPHMAVALIGLYGALIAPSAPQAARLCLVAAGLLLALGVAIALYHVGVEARWWQGPQSCAGVQGIARTIAEMEERLKSARLIRCDAVAWSLWGISLAGYNALFSAVLAAGAFLAAARPAEERRAA